MTDRPVIFSAPMVHALIVGRKTQTRRVLKHGWAPESRIVSLPGGPNAGLRVVPCAAGDRLWVRETWSMAARGVISAGAVYKADGWSLGPSTGARWRSPIHMPRRLSRLTLTVTDVRVERLQEISEADAKAEGVETWAAWLMDQPKITAFDIDRMVSETAELEGSMRAGFAALWNSINGPGAWQSNPWVAVVTFTVKRRNIDQGGR